MKWWSKIYSILMESTKSYRSKPLVIIYGCTGTGKTKLSIELAKRFPNKAEIINADAMQLYKGLDIVTNKATKEEMDGVEHHLIGFLEPLYKDYIVQDYRKQAVEIIDNLMENDKLPILVGGTNYYVESVLWDILIDDSQVTNDNKRKANEDDPFFEKHSSSLKNLDDSSLTNKEIYDQLNLIDPQSAQKIHPNDRRKMCRALEIFYQHGQTKSKLIDEKNSQNGSACFHGPLRYTNVCIFLMTCQQDILNKRLDDRVDAMLANGLLNELEDFQAKSKDQLNGQSLAEYSQNYQVGIFQSIGFKEFHDYLNCTSNGDKQKQKNFNSGISAMKSNTRRYAKKQLRWVLSRFIKRSNEYTPSVYELDTTDLSNWNRDVSEKAWDILSAIIDPTSKPSLHKPLEKQGVDEEIFEHNKCEICDKVFINKSQWNAHLNGQSHMKAKAKQQGFKTTKQRAKEKHAELTL